MPDNLPTPYDAMIESAKEILGTPNRQAIFPSFHAVAYAFNQALAQRDAYLHGWNDCLAAQGKALAEAQEAKEAQHAG